MTMLPCPFCGKTEDELCPQYHEGVGEWVQCPCGAEGPLAIGSDDCVKLWNHRVTIREPSKVETAIPHTEFTESTPIITMPKTRSASVIPSTETKPKETKNYTKSNYLLIQS